MVISDGSRDRVSSVIEYHPRSVEPETLAYVHPSYLYYG